MNAHVAEECKMAFVPCPRGCGKRVLRFALAEHKASCAFGEAGFVPSHTLARTPPARAGASSNSRRICVAVRRDGRALCLRCAAAAGASPSS